MKAIWVGILVFVFFAGAGRAQSGRALLISDFHLVPGGDPSQGRVCAIAQAGEDSNDCLLRSVFDEIARHEPFDFIVYAGDGVRHGAKAGDGSFAAETTVIEKLKTLHKPVMVAIGNNDSPDGDYRMGLHAAFLKQIAGEIGLSGQARADFETGGYYSMRNPDRGVEGQDVIVLNSVFWSCAFIKKQEKSECGTYEGGPGKVELDWLDRTLAQARHAVLVMHVPPGMDAFASTKGTAVFLWGNRYETRFSEIVEKYRANVKFGIAAHIHRDDFRVVTGADGAALLPIRIVSSVSPNYKNRPAFAVMEYEKPSGEVKDFRTYSLDQGVKTYCLDGSTRPWDDGYSFFSAYGIRKFDAETVYKMVEQIQDPGKGPRKDAVYLSRRMDGDDVKPFLNALIAAPGVVKPVSAPAAADCREK